MVNGRNFTRHNCPRNARKCGCLLTWTRYYPQFLAFFLPPAATAAVSISNLNVLIKKNSGGRELFKEKYFASLGETCGNENVDKVFRREFLIFLKLTGLMKPFFSCSSPLASFLALQSNKSDFTSSKRMFHLPEIFKIF